MRDQKGDALLVLRAQSGDRKAMDMLLRDLQVPLFGLIKGIVGEDARSQDVLQDTFVIVCRKLKWLRDPIFFRSWTYRIATRESLRCLKKERRWREQIRDEGVLQRLPEDTAELDPGSNLTTLLARVSPASRAVLVLHYQRDMPLKEVAQVLGLPLGTIKSRLAYGLSHLRKNTKRHPE